MCTTMLLRSNLDLRNWTSYSRRSITVNLISTFVLLVVWIWLGSLWTPIEFDYWRYWKWRTENTMFTLADGQKGTINGLKTNMSTNRMKWIGHWWKWTTNPTKTRKANPISKQVYWASWYWILWILMIEHGEWDKTTIQISVFAETASCGRVVHREKPKVVYSSSSISEYKTNSSIGINVFDIDLIW